MFIAKPYLSRNTDVRFFSLGLVNDIDAVNEDIFQTASEIWCGREVRQVLLYYSTYIHLSDRCYDSQLGSLAQSIIPNSPIFK